MSVDRRDLSAGVAVALAALWALLGAQGARIGSVEVPAISFWWPVVLLGVVSILAPRRDGLPPGKRAWIWAAALFLLYAVFTYGRTACLDPPLRIPVLIDGERSAFADSLQLPLRRDLRRLTGERRGVTIEGRGVIEIPRGGNYRFALYCDDACELRIGAHILRARGSLRRDLDLEAGEFPLTIRYRQVAGPASLRFGWNTPRPVELLPIEYFIRSPTEGAPEKQSQRLGAHLALASLIGWWLAVSIVVRRAAREAGRWKVSLRESRFLPAAAALLILYGGLARFEALLVHSGLAGSSPAGSELHRNLLPWLPGYATFNPASAPSDPYRADVRSYLDRAETMTPTRFYDASFREPFYVALVQPFLAAAGGELGILIQSFVFSCATLVLFYLIARKLYGRHWGVVLLVPVVLHEWLIREAPTGYRMSAYAFFVLAFVGWLFVFRRETPAEGAVGGAFAGLVCLIRLSGLSLVLPLVALKSWTLPHRARLVYAGVFLAVAGFLVAPFLVNNYRVHGDPFYSISFHTEFWLRAEGLDEGQGPVAWTRYFTDFGRAGRVATGTFWGMTFLPLRTFWNGLAHFPLLDGATLALGILGLIASIPAKKGFLPLAYLGHLVPFAYIQNFPSGEMPRFVMPAYFFLVLAAPSSFPWLLTLAPSMAKLKSMKRFVLAILLCSTGLAAASTDDRLDRLSKEHRDWLEKEVVYIISGREREAFLDLESEEERRAFIEAFWQRRDPDPLTPVNEFKEEHYRRIEYANEYLGRESAVPGWMTDRGKMYIILGEPRDREDFTSVPMLYPTELWFYDQNKEKGLPPLYLLFWQEHQAGPYRLFNHFLDQPEDLMPAQPLDRENSRMMAYQLLQDINPALAHASITMRADQGAMANIMQPARAELDFQALLSDIYTSPFRSVDTRYVDAAEDAKGLVETEYLFNYVPNAGTANVLPGPGGTSFVHYALEIEPQHMTLAKDPEKNVYYTSFELRGEVTTPDEKTVVVSFTKEPYIQLTESQFQDVGYRAFSYRDMFPLTEGEFRFRVVLKNRARSEYTMFESDLRVPERPAAEPFLGVPVLLYGMARHEGSNETGEETYRTYRLGSVSLDPNAKRTVAIGNYLMAHVPLENVGPEYTLSATVVSREQTETETVLSRETHKLDFYERPVVLRIPLEDAPGGRYRLVVELRHPGGETVATELADFDISPRAEIHRPWALRDSFEGEDLGLVRAALAEQSLRLGRIEKARRLASEALEDDPNAITARLLLGRMHLDEGNYTEAIRLLEPARAQAPENFEILVGLGDAHVQVGNYRRALELFERAAELRRPDPPLLNALGLCHSNLGNTAQAVTYLERSLELDPAQEAVRSLLERLQSPPPPPR